MGPAAYLCHKGEGKFPFIQSPKDLSVCVCVCVCVCLCMCACIKFFKYLKFEILGFDETGGFEGVLAFQVIRKAF